MNRKEDGDPQGTKDNPPTALNLNSSLIALHPAIGKSLEW